MVWGGLRPIASQVVLDAIAISGLLFATLTAPTTKRSVSSLLAVALLVILANGPTNRWTMSFPLIPLLVLQGIRHIPAVAHSGSVARYLIGTLSIACIMIAAALCIFFPAVEIPPVEGPYHVGVIDLYLPVHMSTSGSGGDGDNTCSNGAQSLPVRILYPTHEKPQKIPYLLPSMSREFCSQMMRLGAPPPLRHLDWFLHSWRLIHLRARYGATLAESTEPFPLVMFSHGLAGTAFIYSYQTMSLAAHGHIVVSLTHQDGSAPLVRHANGTLIKYDFDIIQLHLSGNEVEYVRQRRKQTEFRVNELVAATEAVHQLNEEDIPQLKPWNMSLKGRINTQHTFFMGHSFGGATSLTAIFRRPDLALSVIAHEPAIDWMPDYARRSLYSEERLAGLPLNYTGGTGGWPETPDAAMGDYSIHEKDILFLVSHEWSRIGWMKTLETLHQHGRLGQDGRIVDVCVIDEAHHTEFSDVCMLTPLWLGRAVGTTGKRNPVQTAKEIEERTRSFIESVRQSAQPNPNRELVAEETKA
jgi:pimeloyl-ACP methyl ester carboxylesterase